MVLLPLPEMKLVKVKSLEQPLVNFIRWFGVSIAVDVWMCGCVYFLDSYWCHSVCGLGGAGHPSETRQREKPDAKSACCPSCSSNLPVKCFSNAAGFTSAGATHSYSTTTGDAAGAPLKL